MSGSCPRSDGSRPRARGFTLLEILIVLALVSIVAAMVAPRLQRTYDAVARSGNRAEAVRQLERLPLLARDSGRAIVVPADDGAALARLLQLPPGWQAKTLDPLRIEANGLCHGARIRVQGDGAAETWTLSAPDCGIPDAL
jgi:prepilin-type N-terminal cleavage/methylation domain-containing protein